MLLSATTMRALLLLSLLGMSLLAGLFLRRRQLPLIAYFGWGLLVVMLPALGAFIVLLAKPGVSKAR
jgi:hypothetical protein